MLQNHLSRGEKHLRSLGFIISVDVESKVDPEVIRLKLADALTWMEGVDKPDVDFLGDITNYSEDGKDMNVNKGE